jgi:hypothetical protein
MGLSFEDTDCFVDDTWIDAVVVVLGWHFGFVVLAGVFMASERFEEARLAFTSKPVSDDDVADAKGFGKVVNAGFWEGVGVLGVFEEEEAVGVPVVFGEGWAVTEVRVSGQKCIELINSGDG